MGVGFVGGNSASWINFDIVSIPDERLICTNSYGSNAASFRLRAHAGYVPVTSRVFLWISRGVGKVCLSVG
jgi:hypothetical protein